MRQIVISASIILAVFAAAPAASAADSRFYMMTAATAVDGTRDLEAGAPNRAITRSLPIAQDTRRMDRRTAALINLCIGHTIRREYDAALAYCEQAVSVADVDAAAALVNRGVVRTLTGDAVAGAQDFEQAIALDPGAYQARANLRETLRTRPQLAQDLR
jgi:hypothetical protein